MAGIFSIGFQICCQQSFMALGQAKVSLLLACLRKIIPLIHSNMNLSMHHLVMMVRMIMKNHGMDFQ